MRFRFFRGMRLALVLLGALTAVPAAFAQAASTAFTSDQRQAIESIVKDMLEKNPELIVDALQAAKDKLQNEAKEKATVALAGKKREVFNDPDNPVGGNPKGDVTMVEFFDYHCPYCKMVEPPLEKLLSEDKEVRFVYKEFPILGPDSEIAARAALAAHKQGKYEALHRALMALKGQTDESAIMKTVASVGLDVERVKRDMKSPEIERMLQANFELADALDIHGTPAFIIGDQIVSSAITITTMKQLIEKARAK